MTVKRLKEILESYADDDEVVFAYPSGDHWGNQVARPVTRVDDDCLVWSEYHRQWKVLKPENEPGDGDKTKDAVVLS